MHLRNYEKPDGRSNGQPEVLVTRGAVKHLGMPVVNYDSLHQFLTDDLQVPYEQRTSIKLYGRSDSDEPLLLGFHVPYTRTVHVNAAASELVYSSTGGTMRVLSHEAKHRADSTNRKVLTAAEIAARWACFKAGYEVVSTIPYLSVFAIHAGVIARSFYYRHEGAEKRARAEEQTQATTDHETDILFPLSDRTSSVIHRGKLPLETIKKLGRPASDEYFASDKPVTHDTRSRLPSCGGELRLYASPRIPKIRPVLMYDAPPKPPVNQEPSLEERFKAGELVHIENFPIRNGVSAAWHWGDGGGYLGPDEQTKRNHQFFGDLKEKYGPSNVIISNALDSETRATTGIPGMLGMYITTSALEADQKSDKV